VVGAIAAGDKVVADTGSELFKLLRSAYNDAIAVEMEGFGFLSAVFAYPSIRAIVVRGISDMVAGKNDDGGQGKEENRQQKAANHAGAFAFELLAKLESVEKSEAQSQYNVAGDYVLGDKVMGDKMSGDKNSGARSVSLNNVVQDAVIITGDHNQVVLGGGELPEKQTVSGSQRGFYERQLARKQSDLVAVEQQLDTVLSRVDEEKLLRHGELLLAEINKLELMLGQQLPQD
jgi:Phosphorylase superfamily